MNTEWRRFLAALRFITRPGAAGVDDVAGGGADAGAGAGGASVGGGAAAGGARYIPLAGLLVGLAGAAVYWTASQLWPSSVAVVAALLATVALTTPAAEFTGRSPGHSGGSEGGGGAGGDCARGDGPGRGALYWIFVLLIEYNALMALSAANVPFRLPAYFTLGLILIAGQALSHGLAVSVAAGGAEPPRVGSNDLVVALILGLAPAALLGIPGLAGAAAAILMRLGMTACGFARAAPAKTASAALSWDYRPRFRITQHLTEVCFYLGALATWKYI